MTNRPPVNLPSPTLRDWDRADLAGLVLELRGRRVILVNEAGSHYEHRAWSELRTSAGALVLDVVTEQEWAHFKVVGKRPAPVRWPAAAAWVEM